MNDDFKNPFSNLIRREYNITNLKKILDVFPTSLKVKQLTSTQLLNQLRSLIVDKDITIEELLARLENREGASNDLNGINDTISQLATELNLDTVVNDAITNTADQARINSLLSRGYIQISDLPLYVKVNKDPTSSDEFYIDHTDENAGFPESDLKQPNSVSFVNVSKKDDIWIKKVERWTSDLDGFYEPNRFDRNNFGPTNAFRFTEFTDLHTRAYKISKDSDVLSPVTLYYKSKDDYKQAGLKRSGETNEWFGFMDIKAKLNSSDNIDSVKGVSIGNMRLYRDRN